MNATWLLSLYPRTWRARHGAAMRAELERRSATFVDVADLGLDALDSWLQPGEQADPTPDQPTAGIAGGRPSKTWMSVLFAHVVVFVIINAILAAINLLTDRSTLWFVYPLWGTGITLLLHIGLTFPGRDFLRAHALLSAWIAIGLLGIDIMTGDPGWAMWAIWPLASLVVTHALRSRRIIDNFGSHTLMAALIGVELLCVTIVNLSTASDLAVSFGFVLATVIAHAMIRYGQARLLSAHSVLFVIVNALLLLKDTLEGGGWWVQYPLITWSTLLAIHAFLATRAGRDVPASASHTPAALVRFADRSALRPATRRLQSFLTHAALFGIGALELLIVSLVSSDAVAWMVWPLGVWLVILNAHAGVRLMPDRPLFAINLFGGATVALGLAAIDASADGGTWAYWPIAAWLIVLAMHAGAGLARARTWFRPHVAGTAVAVAILLLLYATGIGDSWVVWPIWGLAILLAIHAGIVALPRQPVLGAWVLAGGVISAGLVLIDAEAGGRAWAYWPVAAWVFISVVIFGLGIDVSQMIAIDRDHHERSNSRT